MERQKTQQVAVRLPEDDLRRLEAIGKTIKPLALNRTEMIRVAVAEYLANYDKGHKAPKR